MSHDDIEECILISKKLNTEKQVFFTLYYINEFYFSDIIQKYLKLFNYQNTDFLTDIFDERENRIVKRDKSYYDSVFDLVFTGEII